MLSKERIKEAENNIKIYVEEGLLKKTRDDIAEKIFIKNSKESLKAANILLKENILLWTIVTSYYAMFYMANAALIKQGYKTGNKIVHKVAADALIAITRKKLKNTILENYEEIAEEAQKIAEIKTDEVIESFDFERKKRNTIQYQTIETDIQTKAKTSLQRAQEFLFEMEKIL